jgi:N-acetylglucosamine kinase-like BadF-type ATPase
MTDIIGIDAGGSKTRVIHASVRDSVNSDLQLIGEADFGSYNYRQDGITGLKRLIKQILASFQIENIEATLLLGGFAGAATPKSHKDIQRTFERHGFRRNLIRIISDADLLLMAIGDEGIVLTAGTGSICVGRKKESSGDGRQINVRAGGYGFRSYSEPGGYQLGMKAIDAAFRIEDGRGQEPTVLFTRIKDHFGVSSLDEIIPLMYPRSARKSNVIRQIAAIAKVVLKAANEGDKTANRLVSELVDNLADHIQAVYKKLGLKNPLVGLHGGLFSDPNRDELLIRPLMQHAILKEYDLRFITLGTGKGDNDPLIEAMRLGVKSFVD